MTIREDIQQYLGDYRGILGWLGFTDLYTHLAFPGIEIPLYIKESPIPFRKPKTTEVSTIQTRDAGLQVDTSTNLIFFGSPDLLQVQLSGWTITPVQNSQWAPVDSLGNPIILRGMAPPTSIPIGNLSYNDLIGYLVQGRFSRNPAGTWQRKDPDYYISPRGQKYSNPVIQQLQLQATPIQKKQAFDMTLVLET